MPERRPHAVYILSLWEAQTEAGPVWRAWLQDSATGERQGFATLDELCDYLRAGARLPEPESPAAATERPGREPRRDADHEAVDRPRRDGTL